MQAVYTNFHTFDGYYGLTYLHTFVKDGYTFTWFTSKDLEELEKGDIVTLKGTIKEHKEYKGYKQTVVTRCKIAK